MGIDRGPRPDAARRERLATAGQRARERAASGYEVRGGGFRPRSTSRGGRRWSVILASVVVVLLVAWLTLPPLMGGLFRALAEENPDLMRFGFVADSVATVMEDRPDTPAGTDPTPVEFVIQAGASSREITDDLVERELVTDRLAFSWVLASEGTYDDLRFGRHMLNRTMTPREVAGVLQGEPQTGNGGISVALRQGLRLEQVTALLLTIPDLPFQPAEFYELAVEPPDGIREAYSMLDGLPEGTSLEGFLASGVFDLDPEASAEDLLRMLLDARQAELEPLIPQARPATLANFYEVLTIASIVEAETRLDTERAVVAGVYLNRLDQAQWPTRLLNADPTVIYGNDTQELRDLPLVSWDEYVFWALPGGSMGDVVLEGELAGFQTYRSRGIPPGPIRSPSLVSINAVLNADTAAGYLFFVSKNDGSGSHAFARTFEEHQQNIDLYLGGGTPDPGTSNDIPSLTPAPGAT